MKRFLFIAFGFFVLAYESKVLRKLTALFCMIGVIGVFVAGQLTACFGPEWMLAHTPNGVTLSIGVLFAFILAGIGLFITGMILICED